MKCLARDPGLVGSIVWTVPTRPLDLVSVSFPPGPANSHVCATRTSGRPASRQNPEPTSTLQSDADLPTLCSPRGCSCQPGTTYLTSLPASHQPALAGGNLHGGVYPLPWGFAYVSLFSALGRRARDFLSASLKRKKNKTPVTPCSDAGLKVFQSLPGLFLAYCRRGLRGRPDGSSLLSRQKQNIVSPGFDLMAKNSYRKLFSRCFMKLRKKLGLWEGLFLD